MPRRFAAVNFSTDEQPWAITLRRSADGSVVRQLVPPLDGGYRLWLRTQGQDVYYVEDPGEGVRTGCEDTIYRVSRTGGSPVEIADGFSPAISADGRWLAYATAITSSGRCRGDRGADLVVRDLRSGAERRWVKQPYDGQYPFPRYTRPYPSAWLPDGRRLIYSLTIGDPASQLFVLDRTQGDGILDAREIPHDRHDIRAVLGAGDHTLVLTHQEHEGPRPSAFRRLDIGSGEMSGVRRLGIEVQSPDADATGRFVIMRGHDLDDYSAATWVWDRRGEARRIGAGYQAVAWVADVSTP